MKTAAEILKTLDDLANKVLDLAEEEGLTLGEVLEFPNRLDTIIKSNFRKQEVPYKRNSPQ